MQKIDKTARSKSCSTKIRGSLNLNHLKNHNFFLKAPSAGDDDRFSSHGSEFSMETNSFRRGMDAMISSRRKSTLFEVCNLQKLHHSNLINLEK